jgi:hypothetical protein
MSKKPRKAKKFGITPMRGKVLVHNIETGDKRTKSGIIILDDDGKDHGIRERWAQVYAVGPDVTDIQVGEWCLIKHGRWSRGVPFHTPQGVVTVRLVDWPDAVLLAADEPPSEVDHG